jgi:hypothetical protein
MRRLGSLLDRVTRRQLTKIFGATAAAVAVSGVATAHTNPTIDRQGALDSGAAATAALATGAHVVTSPSALAGLRTTQGVAYLAMPGRSGFFVWRGAVNLSAQVRADPAQAIYVAPKWNTSGASGAWVRQYSGAWDFGWFGGVGDGVTDNSAAFNGFGRLARYYSANFGGVELYFQPGIYNYNYENCVFFLINISPLRLMGYGATLQNTYGGSASFTYTKPFPDLALGSIGTFGTNTGTLIASTGIGATSVTLLTPAEAANYPAGSWVAVSSIDIQYTGVPGNVGQLDYAQLVSPGGNPSTGVVPLDRTLRYGHLSTFPDDAAYVSVACGAARVTLQNNGGGTVTLGDGEVLSPSWDVDATIEGFRVNQALNSNAQTYATLSGRRIKTINWTGVGFSESACGEHTSINPRILYNAETDKNVGSVIYIGMDSPNIYINGGASASLDRFTLIDSKIAGFQSQAKSSLVQNSDLGQFQFPAAPYGLSSEMVFQASRIYDATYVGHVLDNTVLIVVDGTKISFASGTFTLNKADLGAGLGGFNVVPGQHLGLQGVAAFEFTGDMGFGIVTDITEDSTNVYIATSYSFSTLPGWCTGSVYLFHSMEVVFKNCTGCDNVRLFSRAAAAGARYFEYFDYVYANKDLNGVITFVINGAFGQCFSGQLVSIEVNVIQAAANSNATVQFGFPTGTFNGTTFVADTDGTVLTVNVGIVGNRIINAAGVTLLGTDTFKINNTTATSLPAGHILSQYAASSSGTFGQNCSAGTSACIMEFILTTTCGQTRKLLPANLTVGGMSGLLP